MASAWRPASTSTRPTSRGASARSCAASTRTASWPWPGAAERDREACARFALPGSTAAAHRRCWIADVEPLARDRGEALLERGVAFDRRRQSRLLPCAAEIGDAPARVSRRRVRQRAARGGEASLRPVRGEQAAREREPRRAHAGRVRERRDPVHVELASAAPGGIRGGRATTRAPHRRPRPHAARARTASRRARTATDRRARSCASRSSQPMRSSPRSSAAMFGSPAIMRVEVGAVLGLEIERALDAQQPRVEQPLGRRRRALDQHEQRAGSPRGSIW